MPAHFWLEALFKERARSFYMPNLNAKMPPIKAQLLADAQHDSLNCNGWGWLLKVILKFYN
ncbi:hypothetical protein EBU99_07610 [bacterium]|nr:hypothetical protein [bacterium]